MITSQQIILLSGIVATIIAATFAIAMVNTAFEDIPKLANSPKCSDGTYSDFCKIVGRDNLNTFFYCKGYGNSSHPANLSECQLYGR